MQGWMMLWKVFFVLALSVFAIMAVWVVVWGARDIMRLLRRMEDRTDSRREHQD